MDVRRSDRFLGSLLGLALGDVFGAPYEGGILERALWAIIGKSQGKRRWTDDTQMTVNVAESLVHCGCVDQDDLAHRFARSYRWSRGYSPGTARALKNIRRGQPWQSGSRSYYPEGTFGNGGAMRAPAVGLFFANGSEEEICKAVRDVAVVTHAHPLGQEGAVMVGLATALALNDTSSYTIIERLTQRAESEEFVSRLDRARTWLQQEDIVAPRIVATELGNGVAAYESSITAIYLSLVFRARTFDELLNFAISLGGDVDTIASMAGAIWGAGRGVEDLPRARLEQLEQRDYLETLAQSLAEVSSHRPPGSCT